MNLPTGISIPRSHGSTVLIRIVGVISQLIKLITMFFLPNLHCTAKWYLSLSEKWDTHKDCLVVWNMNFIFIGNVIIPTDELIFFRGVGIPPTRRTILIVKMMRTH